MSTITTLNSGDSGPVSRGVLNTNLANLNSDKIETSVLDTDGTLAANSDAKVATQKAVKSYVDGRTVVSTSGVSAGPASSSTQTITHGLGKTPSIIRINGVGNFTLAGAARLNSQSHGTYNTTGNRCIYITSAASTHSPTSSSVYSVYLDIDDVANTATGIVQNITSTTFDIVWTTSADVSSKTYFIWEAQ